MPTAPFRLQLSDALIAVGCIALTCLAPTGCLPESDPTPPDDTGVDAAADAQFDGTDFTPIGERCETPTECGPEAACVGDPSGRTTCMQFCASDGDICEDGSVCTERAQGEPVCYIGGELPAGSPCDSNLQCSAGLLCAGVQQGDYYCIRACDPDAGKPNPRCDSTGSCVKSAPTRGVCRPNVGQTCATAQGCQAGSLCPGDLACLTCSPETTQLHDYFPGGYCSRINCQSDSACPGDAACRALPDPNGPNVCIRTCDAPADCRLDPGYTCLQPSDCANTSSPTACRDFLDERGLCLPDDASPW